MNTVSLEIEKWFAERPLWLQDAARRLILNGAVSPEDLKQLITLCKSEAGIPLHGKSTTQAAGIPKRALQSSETQVELRLNSIFDLKGVNALAPRKPLQFGDAPLTVVYGPTGSGKSGYVRVLKQACGARKAGSLHGNAFNNATQVPTYKFSYTGGTESKVVTWSLSAGRLAELTPIEIYDDDCAQAYLNEECEATFEPGILSLFTQLTDVCARVSQALTEEINSMVSKRPDFPIEFQATQAGDWYGKVSHLTSIVEIEGKSKWNPELEDELSKLNQRLAENKPAERAANLRKQKQRLIKLHDDLRKLRDELSDQKCAAYFGTLRDAQAKRKVADIDAKKVFENAPLEGVGSESWKLLWQQARLYSEIEAYKEVPFPNVADGARCVLCQQPLDPEARNRFVSFESFIKGQLEQEAATAEKRLIDIVDKLVDIPSVDELSLLLDSAGITEEAERQDIVSYCGILEKRRDSLLIAANLAAMELLPGDVTLVQLEGRASSVEQQAQSFDNDAKGENRPALQKRAKELGAQKWLHQQRASVQGEVGRLKSIKELEQARQSTNTQALSRKKSDLAEELITEKYIERFQKELEMLGASSIRVELVKTRAGKGHVYHQIRLKNAVKSLRPSEVLSEGELRIVSLADFLADVEGRGNRTPFIFDDPISSLDQDFEEATVKRLVGLSKKRQVIVFTHRLSMLALLKAETDKQGVSCHVVGLNNEQWGAGEPSDSPLHAQKPREAVNTLLKDRIPKARKALESGSGEYEIHAKAICSEMRKVMEHVVQSVLLDDIVNPFRRDIHTLKIRNLSRIAPADCALLDGLVTKYSKHEHAQPDETPVSLPLPDELKADLDKLGSWLDEFKKRPLAHSI
jgi:energy-coupling factor transporter ATP-binding protein EcfA2